MDDSYGTALKTFRQQKNVEAKALANEMISYPQLLKFENGQTMISVEKLFYLLDSLNVSAAEYENVRLAIAQRTEEKLFFNRQTGEAFWHKNIAKLNHLLKEAQKKLESDPINKRYQINVIDIKACLHRLNPSYLIAQNEVQQLMNYLISINEWSYFEAWLLSNTVEIFSDIQARTLVNKMIHPKIQMIHDKSTQSRINLALLNTISYFIENQHFTPIHEWFDYLDSHISSDLAMYDRAGLEYHKALLRFCQAPKIPENLAHVERCIAAFETLGCFNLVNIMSDELNRYKKKYHI